MSTDTNRVGTNCPVCGEGCLTSHVRKNDVEYGGQHRALDVQYSECDFCGSDIATEAQTKINKRAMIAFKKEVDGMLSGVEIRRFRDTFGLKQDVCAELFGGGAVAFSRYENDDIVQSSQMDRLLRLCINSPANIIQLAKQYQVALPLDVSVKIFATTRENKAIDRDWLVEYKVPKTPDTATKPANDHVFERYSLGKFNKNETANPLPSEAMAA